MSEAALESAARLLGDRAGLRLEGPARTRLARALRSAARDAGRTPEQQAAALRGDPRGLDDLVDLITVQESSFFRHEEQLEAAVRGAARHPAGVVWSAGCGDGEEPWSLAMLLSERGLDGWSVLATDISRRAIERARDGHFTERRLRGLSAARRQRFLQATDDGRFEVAEELRSRVRFAVHNLVREPPPTLADGRIVLCRNVLIYLRPREADALLARLRDHMPPDGMLLIGAAESLRPDHPSFEVERDGDVFLLRPRPRRPAPPNELRRAGDRDPNDALAHVRRALALEAAGDAAGARRAFLSARTALERMLDAGEN